MAQETDTRHRPGSLKQQNKSHKHGRHRTKGEMNRESRGRVNAKTLSKQFKAAEKQAVRRNQAKQMRKDKRDKVLERKRQRGGQYTPPHFVVVVGLSRSADCKATLDLLSSSVSQMEGGEVTRNEQGIVHASIARFKQRVSFYIPPTNNLRFVLDAAKVADSVLFVTSPNGDDGVIDDEGDYCLKCLMGQGMPSALFVCHGFKELAHKKAVEARKVMNRELQKRFPDSAVHSLDTQQDAALIVRKLTEGKTKPVHFREVRPHLLAEALSFEAESAQASEGTLKLSGYLRGSDLSADRLVHVVGWGTYQIAQIDSATDPHPLVLHKPKSAKVSSMDVDEASRVLARPDPTKQISLESEVEVDTMQDEQTWPTAEELDEADDAAKKRMKKLKLKGVSEYQASWLHDSDLEDEDDDDEAEGEAMEAESDEESWVSCSSGSEEDAESVAMTATEGGDEKYDVRFDLEAEQRQLQQRREEREHMLFPDEVETPHDVPARERFARYRGLASFRTSPWDKDEELPADYQRIYRQGNIKLLKKKIMKTELTNSVAMGLYITVHIKGVPKAFMETYQPGSPIVMFGLLPCEQLMSVLHFSIKRDVNCTDTIKSKTRLVFQVGFRRFSACPIFSQHGRGDKHKMERFLPHQDMVVMSVFAPVTFGPCPVLVFKVDDMGHEQVVGSGSLLSVDPDRIIVKRVILSGDQFKMNVKKSVVRFMFFNREDIMYFKKIELRTKMGRRGRILEPLGTHGHMKCQFSGKPMSQDVVLMYLYKRVFPKWTYQPEVPTLDTSQPDGQEQGQAYQMFD